MQEQNIIFAMERGVSKEGMEMDRETDPQNRVRSIASPTPDPTLSRALFCEGRKERTGDLLQEEPNQGVKSTTGALTCVSGPGTSST